MPTLLDRLAELESCATKGPWSAGIVEEGNRDFLLWLGEDGFFYPPDAALIAAARNALPDLIAAAQEAADLLDRWDPESRQDRSDLISALSPLLEDVEGTA